MRAGIYQLAYMEKPQQNKSKKGDTKGAKGSKDGKGDSKMKSVGKGPS